MIQKKVILFTVADRNGSNNLSIGALSFSNSFEGSTFQKIWDAKTFNNYNNNKNDYNNKNHDSKEKNFVGRPRIIQTYVEIIGAKLFSNSFEKGIGGSEKNLGDPLFLCFIAFKWPNVLKSFEGLHELPPPLHRPPSLLVCIYGRAIQEKSVAWITTD
jgi:hypothetical protein